MSLLAFAADVREVLAYEDRVAAMSARGREALRLPGLHALVVPAMTIGLFAHFAGEGAMEPFFLLLPMGISFFSSVGRRPIAPHRRVTDAERRFLPSAGAILAALWYRRLPVLLGLGAMLAIAVAFAMPVAPGWRSAATVAASVILFLLLAAAGAWTQAREEESGAADGSELALALALALPFLLLGCGLAWGLATVAGMGTPAGVLAMLGGLATGGAPLFLAAWRGAPAGTPHSGRRNPRHGLWVRVALAWLATAALVGLLTVLTAAAASSPGIDTLRAGAPFVGAVAVATFATAHGRTFLRGPAAGHREPAATAVRRELPAVPAGGSRESVVRVRQGGGLHRAALRLWYARAGREQGAAAPLHAAAAVLPWLLSPLIPHFAALAIAAMAIPTASREDHGGLVLFVAMLLGLVAWCTPEPLRLHPSTLLSTLGHDSDEVARANSSTALLLGATPHALGALAALAWADGRALSAGTVVLAAIGCAGAAALRAAGARGRRRMEVWLGFAWTGYSPRARWIVAGIVLAFVLLPPSGRIPALLLATAAAGAFATLEALRRGTPRPGPVPA